MTKHPAPRVHGTDDEPPPDPIDVGESGGQTKPGSDPPPPGTKSITLLPADRSGPGTVVSIPESEFGLAVTIDHVLYIHVSNRPDGTWEFIPFSAK